MDEHTPAHLPAEPPAEPIRLKHSVCTECGYQMDGVELRGGVAICPECGHANIIGFGVARQSLRTTILQPVVVWAVAGAFLFIITWTISGSPGMATIAAACAVCVGLVMGLIHGLLLPR